MKRRGFMGHGAAAGAIAAISLTVGSLGIAAAANGGSLVLGHHNTATTTTTLADSKGTPLTLIGKKSKPPLSVNSSQLVKHLNASLLDGQSASGLVAQGSTGQTAAAGPGVTLSDVATDGTVVAMTATLRPGTYYVSATAIVGLKSPSSSVDCFVGTSANEDKADAIAPDSVAGVIALSETVSIKITKPEAIGEYCLASPAGATGGIGGIYAIKVAHSTTGTTP
jgi:hypothetical protein